MHSAEDARFFFRFVEIHVSALYRRNIADPILILFFTRPSFSKLLPNFFILSEGISSPIHESACTLTRESEHVKQQQRLN